MKTPDQLPKRFDTLEGPTHAAGAFLSSARAAMGAALLASSAPAYAQEEVAKPESPFTSVSATVAGVSVNRTTNTSACGAYFALNTTLDLGDEANQWFSFGPYASVCALGAYEGIAPALGAKGAITVPLGTPNVKMAARAALGFKGYTMFDKKFIPTADLDAGVDLTLNAPIFSDTGLYTTLTGGVNQIGGHLDIPGLGEQENTQWYTGAQVGLAHTFKDGTGVDAWVNAYLYPTDKAGISAAPVFGNMGLTFTFARPSN